MRKLASKKLEALHKQVDGWNLLYPAGTPVIVTKDLGGCHYGRRYRRSIFARSRSAEGRIVTMPGDISSLGIALIGHSMRGRLMREAMGK